MSEPVEFPLSLWCRKERTLLELFESAVWQAHLANDEVSIVRPSSEWRVAFEAWREGAGL